MTFESAEELAIAQAMAAERHPSIAHLAEFIVAEDAQGVMELAADMSQRLAAAGKQPGPHTTADDGEETPPAEQEEKLPSSAEILESVRKGERWRDSHDARREFIRSKLLEAGNS